VRCLPTISQRELLYPRQAVAAGAPPSPHHDLAAVIIIRSDIGTDIGKSRTEHVQGKTRAVCQPPPPPRLCSSSLSRASSPGDWPMTSMELLAVLQHAPLDFTTTVTASVAAVSLWLLYACLRTDPEKAVDFAVPAPEQCRPAWKGKALQDVTIKVPGSSAIQCYAPATGQLLGLVNPATPDGIDRAIARATEAQQKWAASSFVQRRRVLKTLLKFILDNQDDIVRAACLDSGKTRVDALFGEVLVTVEKLKWTIDHGEKALQPSKRPSNFLMFYKHNEVRYEPLGVVGACVSWK
jgi:hypothetical protein